MPDPGVNCKRLRIPITTFMVAEDRPAFVYSRILPTNGGKACIHR